MFVLKHDPTFVAEVTIPRADGKDGTLKLKFKHKGQDDLKAFFESLTDEKAKRNDNDVLMEIVGGWEEVDAPFTKENFELLLKTFHGASKAIFDAYVPALMEGKVKN